MIIVALIALAVGFVCGFVLAVVIATIGTAHLIETIRTLEERSIRDRALVADAIAALDQQARRKANGIPTA